jgi:hypothetical protein
VVRHSKDRSYSTATTGPGAAGPLLQEQGL